MINRILPDVKYSFRQTKIIPNISFINKMEKSSKGPQKPKGEKKEKKVRKKLNKCHFRLIYQLILLLFDSKI